jgi:ABC-2 type transport system permease protein
MFKALLKKQALETLSAFTLSNKTGKKRKPVAAIGFAVLIVYAFGAFAMMAYEIAKMLCAPLVYGGLGWVYFAFMATIAFVLGFIGSVFTVKVKIYEAKDNDLLLSMPIQPWKILLARTLGLYAYTFAFCALVFVPSSVCYFIVAGFSVTAFIGCIAVTLILPLGALALGFLFGWLLALATAKLRAKNLFTALFTTAFLVAYMVLYSKLNDYLSFVIANGEAVGEKMRVALYPLMQAGLASTGDLRGTALFMLVFCGAFALVYALVAHSFLKIATMKRGGVKNKYKSGVYRQKSGFSALFRREIMRMKNPMILLNVAIGSVFLIILPFVALFNLDFVRGLSALEEATGYISLVLAGLVCLMTATNVITASSVSLEGQNIWQSQVLPVKTQDIFLAKASLHLLLSGVPALFSTLALTLLLRLPVLTAILCVLIACAFALFTATSGLAINLKIPNLHWTNEVVAVKQGVSVLVAMFTNIGVIAALVGGYFLFGKYIPSAGYLAVCFALLCMASGLIMIWLEKRGEKIFKSL